MIYAITFCGGFFLGMIITCSLAVSAARDRAEDDRKEDTEA